MAVTGGFLEVTGNRVIVLADAAERSEEIDEARAQEALRRAEERLERSEEGADLQRALASIRRSRLRLDVRRRRRRPPS